MVTSKAKRRRRATRRGFWRREPVRPGSPGGQQINFGHLYWQAQHGQVGQGHDGGEGLLMVRMIWVVSNFCGQGSEALDILISSCFQ